MYLFFSNVIGKLFQLLDSWAKEKHIRIIAPSLPGYGLSSFKPNYKLQDWVEDMQELFSYLQIDAFHVLGTSFGSIHAAALACLYQPVTAVRNVQLYVGFGPATPEHDPLQGSILASTGKMRNYPRLNSFMTRRLMVPLLRLLSPKDGDVYRSIRYQWEGCARSLSFPFSISLSFLLAFVTHLCSVEFFFLMPFFLLS